MSMATGPVMVPNCAAWRTRYATFALQISFLLGRQLMLGQEPRYTGAPRRQFVARIAPSPKPGACHPCRCRGSGFQTVLVEPCASLPVRALSCSPSAGQTPPGWNEGARVRLAALAQGAARQKHAA